MRLSDPGDAGLDSAALRPGMVVGGKFALLRKIGEGGTGVVFEAEDLWIGRRVALKVLHAHLAERADVLARFRREARAAAMTNHANIIGVFEVGQQPDGAPYIVQELLEGETLRDRLRDRGMIPVREAIEILVPIMGALVTAHRAGVIHRDIKPENIFLCRTPEGGVTPKLIDFGVAKIASSEHKTLTGILLGTPMYMSPEQAGGSQADARTDVWAMGVLLYELFSDSYPYDGPSGHAVLAKILSEDAPPILKRAKDLPPQLATVVHRALERDPARRYQTMEALLEALLAFADRADPQTSTRHAGSFPPPAGPAPHSERITTLDLVSPGESEAPPTRRSPEWARPMVQPELGWGDDRPPPRAPRNREWYAAAAGEALGVNALDEAIDHAEHAIVTCGASGELLGRMRLVQAIAFRWLGHYGDSERCAAEAAELLPRGSTGWYAALGHLALVRGYLNKNDQLAGMQAELARIEQKGELGAPHVVAACRLAISLLRAGHADTAAQALASARAGAVPGTEEEPVVRAWVEVVRAEFALHAGDPAAHVQRLESAVASFADAGDARNACLQRANIGNGYLQLGAYARAKGVLREALAVGEPMKLSFIAPVRANLGFTMARLGDLEQALEIERKALDQCVRESYRRFEIASRIYLGVILTLREEIAPAELELRAAVEASTGSPPIRAFALAHLADLLLYRKRPVEAKLLADEAMQILRALEGVEEGEALIRLVHALSLEATGDVTAATTAVLEARRRLLERADKVTDPRLRRSFLDHIPENARTIALAARYKHARP